MDRVSLVTYSLILVISEREGGLAGIGGRGTPALLAGGAKAISTMSQIRLVTKQEKIVAARASNSGMKF